MRCSPRAVYYNFDQSLWSPPGDPARRVALFFRFGVSDGLANPITHHYNAGIGGKGVVRGRPHGTFGVGWSRLEFSKDLAPFLRQALDPGLEREDAVEVYYKVAVTPWLGMTLDLQVVESKTWAPPSSAACGPLSGSERVTCRPPAGDHHQQRPTGPRCRTAAVRSRGAAQ